MTTEPTLELSEMELNPIEAEKAQVFDLGGSHIAIATPQGWQLSAGFNVAELDERNAPNPRRKTGTARFDVAHSFTSYIDAQSETAVIYGNLDSAQFTAVFDDHWGDTSGWRQYTAVYQPKPTDEWRAWAEADGRFVSASSFAEFIEDWQHTIASPDTAELMDLVRNFRATRKVTFGDEINDTNGDRTLQWKTETSTGELVIPDALTLSIEPFPGAEPIEITARFRYRLDGGQAVFGVKLVQPAKAWREAVEAIADVIQAALDEPILYGSPAK